MITLEVIDGVNYYSAVNRGTAYTAYQMRDGMWWVASRRMALGNNAGGGKYYANVTEVARNCKAFAGLDVLVEV